MTALDARNLSVVLNGRSVLTGIEAEARPGEIVGLIGANGAGKSTLLRALSGLVAPSSGDVFIDGQPLSRLSRQALARRIAYLPQGRRLHWSLDVRTLVGLGRLPHRRGWRPAAEDARGVEAAMARVDVARFASRPFHSLSGGEQARVLLARTLAVEADFLLADEPTTALDPYHALRVIELLRDLAREGRGVVAVLHDLTLAARFCDRLILLHEGRIMAEGAPQAVLGPARLRAAYAVSALEGDHQGERYLIPWRRLSN